MFRSEIAGLQTGLSRVMLREGLEQSQVAELVSYLQRAVESVSDIEIPHTATLTVRGDILGQMTDGDTVSYWLPKTDAEITLRVSADGQGWTFSQIEIFARFGEVPWLSVRNEGAEIYRHDGPIITPEILMHLIDAEPFHEPQMMIRRHAPATGSTRLWSRFFAA